MQQNGTVHRGGFVLLVSSIAALGGLLFGYDTGVISGAILFIQKTFSLSTQMQEITVSVVLIGAIIGALLAGGAADQFGRRVTLIAAGVVFAAGALLSAFAPSVDVLLVGRLIVGVAIGLSSVTAPLYISEAAPRTTRGALVSLYQFAITIGILLAAFVDYELAGAANWPLMLGLAIVPSILLIAGMIMVPESPRWLFANNQEDRGREVLERTRDRAEVDEAIADIRGSLSLHRGTFRELFSPGVRGALGVGIGLAVLQQVTGINTVIYYGPQIFKLAGFSTDAVSILATLGVDVVNCLMTLVAIALIDRIGRKPLLYGGVGGMMVALFALAYAFSQGQGPATGGITLAALMVYVGCFAFSLGPITWLLISEIYPLRVRGRAMSIATLANWAANFVVSLVFLTMIHALGSPLTFSIYGVLCAVTIWFVRVFVRETKSLELESISIRPANQDTALRGLH
jgi:SP family galactose:H+ symporter-like MFS transporter